MYAPPSSSDLSIHGHTVYNMFTTVVFLSQTLRQSGSIPAAESFRDFLSRLRDGNITHDDWQMLLTCTPQNAHQFTHVIRLFYTKERAAEYNLEKLHGLVTPVAKIEAIHSSPTQSYSLPNKLG